MDEIKWNLEADSKRQNRKTKHVSLGNAISIYQIRPLGELYEKIMIS